MVLKLLPLHNVFNCVAYMYSLSTQGITNIKNIHAPTHLSGSSYFVDDGKEIKKRTRSEPDWNENNIVCERYKMVCDLVHNNNLPFSPDYFRQSAIYEDYLANYIEDYRHQLKLYRQKKQEVNRTYRINKSKVRKKISSFTRLNKSKKFLAFYSVSLPLNTPDDVAYVIFNKWLTNLRSNYNLKSYLWIAERQSNGTIHYHLLTNDYLDITKVNRAMARAINSEVKKGNATWGNSSLEKYNGVDVDSPQRPKRRQKETRKQYRDRVKKARRNNLEHRLSWIGIYMAKYITKNDEEFTRLPYHSSRDVSRLFTSHIINDKHINDYIQPLPDDVDDYIIYENEQILHYSFKFIPCKSMFTELDNINNIIYYEYHNPT